MSLLARLEAALERLVEGGAERVFGGRLDLVALGQELYNSAVQNSQARDEKPTAPNLYVVRLSLDDYGHLSNEVERLEARYAASLWSRLCEGGYGLPSPPRVLITPQDSLSPGCFRIEPAVAELVASFTLFGQSEAQEVYPLQAPACLGRGAECDLRIDDPSVSRRHARIWWAQNRFALTDLGSTNGTRVNGVLIKETGLNTNDLIALGSVAFRFVPDLAPGAPMSGTQT